MNALGAFVGGAVAALLVATPTGRKIADQIGEAIKQQVGRQIPQGQAADANATKGGAHE